MTMNAMQVTTYRILGIFALLLTGATSLAQVPVDANGNTVGGQENQANTTTTGNEGAPLLTRQDLQDLVGPVALYPDELLAIVLPAATYPLQVVQAARFLENLESNPNLKPDEDWDDAIVALLNYPEVIALLNEDLDWTWQLGEAVVAQQADVISAVEDFRNTTYVAGNLQSDDYQDVSRANGVIEISPVNDDVIYVPYYEPERVVLYQSTPVYQYYERPYPVYNYPYPASHNFHRGFFWGVTTAFSIGWATDNLSVYHHSYAGHPYYGRSYYDRWWYRRPSIYTHNSIYFTNNVHASSRRYRHGDYWRPSHNARLRYGDQRITHNSGYRQHSTRNSGDRYRDNRHGSTRDQRSSNGRSNNRGSFRTQESHASDRQHRAAGQQRHPTASRETVARQPRSDQRQVRSDHNRPQTQHQSRERSNQETRSSDRRSQERSTHRGNSRGRDESRRSRH